MKKLINDPADVVSEALRGIAAAHPELRVDHANRIIYRRDTPKSGKVDLVSGGGSGHEPLHGGFVGLGMLDAACAGQIFTSPTPDQMLEATKGVDSGSGVLHILKNYTGDVMNFEMAAELAAAETGIGLDTVSSARMRWISASAFMVSPVAAESHWPVLTRSPTSSSSRSLLILTSPRAR